MCNKFFYNKANTGSIYSVLNLRRQINESAKEKLVKQIALGRAENGNNNYGATTGNYNL